MQPKNRQERQSHSHSLLPYFLISVLIHGLIVVLIGDRKPLLTSQSKIEQKPDRSPIEFIIVPPDQKSDRSPPKTKRRAVNNSIARGTIRSKQPPTTNDRGNAVTQSQPTKVAEPSTPIPSKPKIAEPVKPAPPKKQISPQKAPAKSSVATRLPVQPKPTPSTNSGAAKLLGGNFKRSIQEDSGSSFFSDRANASKEAPYATLDAQQDDLGPYFDEIRRRVKRNWQPFSPGQERYTVIVFSIQRSGQITGLRVLETSGNDRVDRDALDAVAKSAPFDALPQSFTRDRLDVQFNFNIYIDRGSFTPNLESNW